MQAEASSEGPGASASEQRGPPPREPPSSSPAYEDRSPADPMADDGKKFVGISRRKAEQISRGDEESVRRNQKYDDKANVEAVLDIPELEEEGKEDLSRMVGGAIMAVPAACAPSTTHPYMPTCMRSLSCRAAVCIVIDSPLWALRTSSCLLVSAPGLLLTSSRLLRAGRRGAQGAHQPRAGHERTGGREPLQAAALGRPRHRPLAAHSGAVLVGTSEHRSVCCGCGALPVEASTRTAVPAGLLIACAEPGASTFSPADDSWMFHCVHASLMEPVWASAPQRAAARLGQASTPGCECLLHACMRHALCAPLPTPLGAWVQVQEADAVWDPELIFTEVASAINSEREKAEGPSEAPDEQKPVAI